MENEEEMIVRDQRFSATHAQYSNMEIYGEWVYELDKFVNGWETFKDELPEHLDHLGKEWDEVKDKLNYIREVLSDITEEDYEEDEEEEWDEEEDYDEIDEDYIGDE